MKTEQAARIAAAAWAKSNSRRAQAANIIRGSCDTAPIVQAFQRAILAERERCAQIADDRAPVIQCTSVSGIVEACDDIAAAIRSPAQ